MKIFIEGTPILTTIRSGVGQYSKRLVEAMANVAPKNDYTVFGFNFMTKKTKPHMPVKKPNVHYSFVRWLPGRGYNLLFKKGLQLPIDTLLGAKPDIVLFPNFVRWPLASKAKSVIVIHDIASYLDLGHFADQKNRRFLTKHVARSVVKTDLIFAVSEFTKNEVIRHYKVDSKRVVVVPPAIDHSDFYPRPDKQIADARHRYKLPEKYMLYVGNIEPRKNLVGLLDAFAALPAAIQKAYPLILIGGMGWKNEEIQARLHKYRALPIRSLGYVPDEDMAILFTAASLFVYPSFYEGFGMPPLEALACGTPVITSNVSAMPEAVGDAAYLIDPSDPKNITKAIETVLADPKMQASMRRKGLAQAKKYTWDNSAKKALAAFKALLNS